MKPESKYYSLTEARAKIQGYCAYQERSHKEVVDKLKEIGLIEEARDLLIGELIQDNFLNETRFAESYVRGKFFSKKWGKIKIKQGLNRHDISSYNLKKAFAQITNSAYRECALELAKKKVDQLEVKNLSPIVIKSRTLRYLASKGYESDICYSVCEELIPFR